MRTGLSLLLALTIAACGGSGGDDDPLDVAFGETTFVVVVNPVINSANQSSLPAPGQAHAGVTVAVDEGLERDTNGDGIVVLAPVAAGTRTLSLSGSGVGGSAALQIAEGDLHEVSLASTEDGTQVMTDVVFSSRGAVVEVTPDTPLSEVNDELGRSDIVVFFHEGVYEGDIEFSGSNVTLFGAGPLGGRVFIDGNVTVSGSSNRIRGVTITGNLDAPGSNVSISFSRVEGNAVFDGSDTVILHNDLCGDVALTGSGRTALNNLGLAPLDDPSGCP